MKRRRVKITGIGFVTPAGIGCEEFLRHIQEPVSRVTALKRWPDEAGAFVAAEVKGFKLENYVDGANPKRVPRHTQFALGATVLALRDAQITLAQAQEHSPVIMIGAALMDFGTIGKIFERVAKNGLISAVPTSVADSLVSGIGAAIGALIGGTTRAMSLQSACCSGLDAIGEAAGLIATGESDLAICGGTEAPLHLHPMLELRLAGLAPGNPEQAERQCRPFDRWRTTGVIGEGACVLVLEPDESPRPAYAHVEGHGYASDMAESSCRGLLEAVRLATGNAGMRPRDIEAVSAWGPGHKLLDAAEAAMMQEYFGNALGEVPVASIKGAIGNPFAAAGAIQAGCAALGLKHGFIPPTVNWRHPDPACPLNLSAKSRFISHRNALVNAHGLSGSNSCLVLTR
ncbi:MAG: beta-ketoacyl synthase N-terminal-like domain-containing protein [Opitutaceae bacterium]|nr:beta-ketoacyl synthase N-terminal-like domain-containing protein [Opitutaceae bacterium]